MSWNLKLNGLNNKLNFEKWTPVGDYTIEGKFTFKKGVAILGNSTHTESFLATHASFNTVHFSMGGTQVDLSMPYGKQFYDGEIIDLKITRVGTTNTINCNGYEATITSILNSGSFDMFGRWAATSEYWYDGELSGIWKFTDGTDDRSYNFETAIHTNNAFPTIVESISSKNAVGVGFSSGYQWTDVQVWGLKFTESLNCATFPEWNPLTDAFDIYGQFIYVDRDCAVLVESSGFSSGFSNHVKCKTGGNVEFRIGSVVETINTGLAHGEVANMRMQRVGNNIYLSINGISKSYQSTASVKFDSFGLNASASSNLKSYTGIIFGKWGFISPEDTRRYSFNAADHGAGVPRIPDNILTSGYDIVGNGHLPTDGTAWTQDLTVADNTGGDGGDVVVTQYALDFAAADVYLSIPEWSATGDFTISLTFTYSSAEHQNLFGKFNSGADYMITQNEYGGIMMSGIHSQALGFVDGITYDLIMTRVGGNITYNIDGADVKTMANAAALHFDMIFDASGLNSYKGKGKGIITLDNGTDKRTYDFTTSGNAKTGSGQPIVIDTTSGQNAVGVGFVGDDSEWINLSEIQKVNGLYFQGSRGYLSFPEWDVGTSDFEITGTYTADCLGNILGHSSSFKTLLSVSKHPQTGIISAFFRIDIELLRVKDITPIDGLVNFKLKRVSGQLTVTFNGKSSETVTDTRPLKLNVIGKSYTGYTYLKGSLTGQVSLTSPAIGDRIYNIDTSPQVTGNPVVIETVSGQNASGTEMISNGVAWKTHATKPFLQKNYKYTPQSLTSYINLGLWYASGQYRIMGKFVFPDTTAEGFGYCYLLGYSANSDGVMCIGNKLRIYRGGSYVEHPSSFDAGDIVTIDIKRESGSSSYFYVNGWYSSTNSLPDAFYVNNLGLTYNRTDNAFNGSYIGIWTFSSDHGNYADIELNFNDSIHTGGSAPVILEPIKGLVINGVNTGTDASEWSEFIPKERTVPKPAALILPKDGTFKDVITGTSCDEILVGTGNIISGTDEQGDYINFTGIPSNTYNVAAVAKFNLSDLNVTITGNKTIIVRHDIPTKSGYSQGILVSSGNSDLVDQSTTERWALSGYSWENDLVSSISVLVDNLFSGVSSTDVQAWGLQTTAGIITGTNSSVVTKHYNKFTDADDRVDGGFTKLDTLLINGQFNTDHQTAGRSLYHGSQNGKFYFVAIFEEILSDSDIEYISKYPDALYRHNEEVPVVPVVGVNLLKFGNKDILDIKYSDFESVYHTVELRQGPVVVWKEGEVVVTPSVPEFQVIETFDISAAPVIKDFVWVESQNAWFGVTYSDTINGGTIEKFDKDFVWQSTFKTGLPQYILSITYDVSDDRLYYGTNIGECYSIESSGTGTQTSRSLGGSTNDYALEVVGDKTYALNLTNKTIKMHGSQFMTSGVVVFSTDAVSPTNIIDISWDGKYWNINSWDNILRRYTDEWVFVEDNPINPEASGKSYRRFYYSKGFWYALSGTEILKMGGRSEGEETPPPPTDPWETTLDGSDDFYTMPVFICNSTTEFKIVLEFTYDPISMVLGRDNAANDWIYCGSNGDMSVTLGGASKTISAGLTENEKVNMIIERGSDKLLQITINGTVTDYPLNSEIFRFEFIGKSGSFADTYFYGGKLSGIWEFTSNITGTRKYDFGVSGAINSVSGVQPVLQDTESGLHATGSNMATDGSNWTEL